MKVTVNFDNVRVIVPCGDGDLLVKDLMQLAITRYKKATAKTPDTWVVIHNLKLSSDGGILDPDDQLNDVADDREQIIAIYEEQTSPYHHHNGGDGTSASSVGTESPDIFQIEVNHNTLPNPNGGIKVKNCDYSDVEITGNHMPTGITPLQVRRGSEPALNRLSPVSSNPDPTKRWSAAVIVGETCDDAKPRIRRTNSTGQSEDEEDFDDDSRGEGSGEEKSVSSRLSRGSGRLSILGSGSEMSRWAEAADRQLYKSIYSDMRDGRREPLGSSGTSPDHSRDPESETSSLGDDREVVIILKNESGPLGIHVVPDYDSGGRDTGLVIQGIESGGRIDRDGRLQVGDRIIEISGRSLVHVSFQKAQEIFKDALKNQEIKLKLVKCGGNHTDQNSQGTLDSVSSSRTSSRGGNPPPPKKPPPPVYPKPNGLQSSLRKDREHDGAALVEGEERGGLVTKVATVTPTKKVPPTSRTVSSAPLTSNTRRIGRKIAIQLTKGPEGLGFSVTTRDNPAGGNCPIYIKNILPKGAAIQDGRLKPGDRLLEVNGLEMTGKSQTEAVSLLRNTPPGGVVDLVVSRQETEIIPQTSLPRKLPPDQSDGDGIFPWKHREVLTFDIPLNDTGSAGLGVSVKGKSTTGPNGPVDLGIFVKSVIHGGAASKDGRLCTNDQLVNINGISLLSMTNTQAMETLRRAMTQGEGPNALPNAITLTVARRIPSSQVNGTHGSGDDSSVSYGSNDRSDSVLSSGSSLDNLLCLNSPIKQNGVIATPDNSASETSETTVIFKPRHGSSDSLNNNNTSEERLAPGGVRKSTNPEDALQMNGRNPVLDRIMGQNSGGNNAGIRNESYLKASHESWGASHLQQALYGTNDPRLRLPNAQFGDDKVVIEDEYANSVRPKQRSRSTERVLGSPHHHVHPHPPKDERVVEIVETETIDSSQLSLNEEEKDANFHRDGFGRQSISEKRHAQLDARNTDTYQRNKKLKDKEKKGNSESIEPDAEEPDCNSPLKIKETSPERKVELEIPSPKTKESQKSENKSRSASNIGNGSVSLVRSSSAESLLRPHAFHKAVEEESESGSSSQGTQQFRRGGPLELSSRQPTINHEHVHHVLQRNSSDDMIHAYNRKDPITKVSTSGNNNVKKKGGLLKGLGSVFKFGKHRKITQETIQKLTIEQMEQEAERVKARKAAQEEQERIQEQYRKLLEQQQRQQQAQQLSQTNKETGKIQVPVSQSTQVIPPPLPPINSHGHGHSPMTVGQHHHHHIQMANAMPNHQQGGPNYSGMSPSRQERMQQLRAQHQKKHQERHGHYPKDEQEEWYEKDLKNRIDKQLRHTEPEETHARSNSFDIYKEMERPGSRRGIADPSKYSHYVNYKEIQQHLRQFKTQEQQQMRRQQVESSGAIPNSHQHQHFNAANNTNGVSSQNQNKTASSQWEKRPISNYFEYESVQALYQAPHQSLEINTSSLPRRTNHNAVVPNTAKKQSSLPHPQQNMLGARSKIQGYTQASVQGGDVNNFVNAAHHQPRTTNMQVNGNHNSHLQHHASGQNAGGQNYAFSSQATNRREPMVPGSKV